MNCNYEKVRDLEDGRSLYRCVNPNCGHERKSRYAADMLHRQCPGEYIPGLGDHVKNAIDTVGLGWFPDWYKRKTGKQCGCKSRQSKLNDAFPGHRSYAKSFWLLITRQNHGGKNNS